MGGDRPWVRKPFRGRGEFHLPMEKLAGSLQHACLMSEAAATGLAGHVASTKGGSHPLSGFPGSYPFLSF